MKTAFWGWTDHLHRVIFHCPPHFKVELSLTLTPLFLAHIPIGSSPLQMHNMTSSPHSNTQWVSWKVHFSLPRQACLSNIHRFYLLIKQPMSTSKRSVTLDLNIDTLSWHLPSPPSAPFVCLPCCEHLPQASSARYNASEDKGTDSLPC